MGEGCGASGKKCVHCSGPVRGGSILWQAGGAFTLTGGPPSAEKSMKAAHPEPPRCRHDSGRKMADAVVTTQASHGASHPIIVFLFAAAISSSLQGAGDRGSPVPVGCSATGRLLAQCMCPSAPTRAGRGARSPTFARRLVPNLPRLSRGARHFPGRSLRRR